MSRSAPLSARSQMGPMAARARAISALVDLFPATPAEMAPARALAAELIGPYVVSEETFGYAHARTGGASMFVHRLDGAVDGAFAMVPLRRSGLHALHHHRFDAKNPDWDQVAEAGEEPAAIYGWGFAASTRKAAAAVVRGAMLLRDEAFPNIPWFTRAATPAGAKVILGKMAYRPFNGSDSGMLWSPPVDLQREHAA